MLMKEGKDAMLVELCRWFIKWGTIDDVFCHNIWYCLAILLAGPIIQTKSTFHLFHGWLILTLLIFNLYI